LFRRDLFYSTITGDGTTIIIWKDQIYDLLTIDHTLKKKTNKKIATHQTPRRKSCVWIKYGTPALHKYIKLIVVNKSLLNRKI
jgi:hypothetical protein